MLNTLEGDPRFFFDDSRSPQAYGTGTEEWGGGGDYWGGRNMTLPLVGHPVGVRRPEDAREPEELIQSAYRFLLADLMPFGRRAVVQLEHGGINQSTEHYQSVTYWYGLPAPNLVLTDALDIGDAASEKSHDYVSPDASEPCELTSRYEWGPDQLPAEATHDAPVLAEPKDSADTEIYAAETKIGRTTTTYSEFTVKLREDNLGVLLRRTLDYQWPNQRAKVFVAQVGFDPPDWQPAGVWYLAGSNTCYHSYPRKAGELGKSNPVVQTSNRRFRDDEFLIPRRLTTGLGAIRVRIEFTPVPIPLLPGLPVGDLAWSEMSYRVYSYVMPKFTMPR